MLELTGLTTHRRGFLGRLAAGAAALGLGGLVAPAEAAAQPPRGARMVSANPEFETWLNKITGKHKMIYDVPEPNDGLAFAWARVFLNTTNETYGTTDGDNTVVIVLRHAGIPFAMKDPMWAKYKFGQMFKITDPKTHRPAIRNPFANMKPGAFPIAGVGVDELLSHGVLVGVCNIALTLNAGIVAKKLGKDGAAVKQEWVANLFPGVQIAPSGVIAVNRAQEKGCAYCFAG
jgi:intracellular sulfur oxidation DsrE/DsrF family protein